ncbi:hypothetical protein LMG28688_03276 [Paraburkholderia caffeinitolerans]|uniref:DUF2917 domain-containing protein n=1 Tax=Paraburkholderia caffeinitolerans TaxID=1723730 RepID=A0A6J5G0Q7_9BURK|nr:DUF2917 domain-containing protein [Paraburkholderia caffeinitolerans]CAB3791248.1 hypothetical protein LMG28688_03276 [Paraburkholderia caffeinitolerans]
MDSASQHADQEGASGPFSVSSIFAAPAHDDALPALSIHFAVPATGTFTWRVRADGTLRVHGARVWLTRACSPYDHWLSPGETLRVYRGERLWLSVDAGNAAARVTLTSAWRPPFATVRRTAGRCADWFALLTTRRLVR